MGERREEFEVVFCDGDFGLVVSYGLWVELGSVEISGWIWSSECTVMVLGFTGRTS